MKHRFRASNCTSASFRRRLYVGILVIAELVAPAQSQRYRLLFFATALKPSISRQFASLPEPVSDPLIEHTKRPIDSAPSNHPDSALLPARAPSARADSPSASNSSHQERRARSQKTAILVSLFPATRPPARPHSLPARSDPGNRKVREYSNRP